MLLWILAGILAGTALILVGIAFFLISSQTGVINETQAQADNFEQTLYDLFGAATVVGGSAAMVAGLGAAFNKRALIEATRRR